MKKHANIPIFIPHVGCPNTCVFCNQRTISGVKDFHPEQVRAIIEESLKTIDKSVEAEIAFFGGSFTGIDRELMTELLEIANEYLKCGRVSSVRCSTRPDYIDPEILDILCAYGVGTVELGLQSTSDIVLNASKRGHSFEDEKRACQLIRERGIELVGQMMIGLPDSTPESEEETARFIIESGAVGARIYPTVVLRDTELCQMSMRGDYTPLETEDAVARSASVFRMFIKNGLKVIRIGLCASENLSSDKTYFAGPNHPALGDMVLGRYFYNEIIEHSKHIDTESGTILSVSVSPISLSRALGQKKINKRLITERLKIRDTLFLTDDNLSEYEVSVTTTGG